ncbi:hypothetical protein Phum_PHUM539270 [Pediculus humanus corporis]|uniref:Uncharacterized protein n=1 Tax=Pediculus humanus subsp. corporis TaxID=121224 RepID=E0VZV9_PEDHC|nr:uncharacterized protein Phum_PHUM539270 [Pediculus humanus corporis]EEB18915.1 hypothetical protein Phum_PHUM539270 [Pediculus humanus corporis]
MLSYVIPVDEKQNSVLSKNHIELELNVQEEEEDEQQQQEQKKQEEEKKNHSDKNGLAFNGISSLSSTQGKMAPTAVHNLINIEQTRGGGILNGGNQKKIIKTHGKVNIINNNNNYVKPAISTESSASSLSSKASDVTSNASQGGSGSTPTNNVVDKLKPKLVQNNGAATKTTSLKRSKVIGKN